MPRQLTHEELASLMKSCVGLTVDPEQLRDGHRSPLADFGLDSLGLLAIVGELENRYGIQIDSRAEACKTPGDFVEVVNESMN